MLQFLMSQPEGQNLLLQVLAGQGLNAPFTQATKALGLTPEEQYLYQYHLKNLGGTGKVMQGGDVSTVFQVPYEGPDGRFYNIPTVWGGQILQPDAAAQQAAKVGWDKWPAYQTEDAAEARYQAMHPYLSQDTAKFLQGAPGKKDR